MDFGTRLGPPGYETIAMLIEYLRIPLGGSARRLRHPVRFLFGGLFDRDKVLGELRQIGQMPPKGKEFVRRAIDGARLDDLDALI